MDALEFLKERKRMCNSYDPCRGCPLEGGYCSYGPNAPEEAYERIIAAVEQWSKEHPRKTRQDVFLEQYPEAKIDGGDCLDLCPCAISAIHRDEYGRCAIVDTKCFICRREFWMQKIGD